MEIVDLQERQDILDISGSIVVSASAGSGKTTILVDKIIRKLSEIKDHQTVAAITFTVKATAEIKNKVASKVSDTDIVVMTNDSFIEFEIIRPFLRDAFGAEYSNTFMVSYEKSAKSSSFAKGLEVLKRVNKLGTYHDIKRNFKFELASEILLNSQAAREYFKAKYAMLFLDEYQDSDMDMHNFFMYVKNELDIDLFIVGDVKQAIYLWRGAQKDIFSLLVDEGMNHFELVTNFRSHPEIVNYANLMHNDSQFNGSYMDEVQHVIHCKTNSFGESFKILCESGELDISKSITIIANVNAYAKGVADELNELGFNFIFIPVTPLDSSTENSHTLKAIACFILDNDYSIYDLVEALRIDQRRAVLNAIENILDPLNKLIPLKDGKSRYDIQSEFFEVLAQFNSYLGSTISEAEQLLLLDALTNGYFKSAFIKSNDLHKVMTVFGSKGLEFKQVISFDFYYDFLNEERKNNHYVCVTRAEEKFIMVGSTLSDYNSKIKERAQSLGLADSGCLYKLIDHTS